MTIYNPIKFWKGSKHALVVCIGSGHTLYSPFKYKRLRGVQGFYFVRRRNDKAMKLFRAAQG